MNNQESKNPIVQSEEEVLKFWQAKQIFEKSVSQREGCPLFSFYDGPPFATGQPHYGNLLPSTIKDVVLRYRTMRGYYVPRRVGWDCHGLPLENLAEKELGQKCKADIEKLGIDKFNQTCRKMVFRYLDEFEQVLRRLGRWADYQDYYATVDSHYTESAWWVFKQLHQKELVYQDYRTAPYCPRCGTPLSNFELNQPGAYRDIKDTSVFVKFPVKGEKDVYYLVWTTTPWTLPANFAVAVNPDAEYVKLKLNGQYLILAEAMKSLVGEEAEELERLKGSQLIGRSYEPIYPMPPNDGQDYRIVPADFVSLEEGTGLVHLAAFGLEDMEVAKEHNLPLKVTVDRDGLVVSGQNLPGEGKLVWDADQDVLADLKKRELLYREEEIEHSYPFCWRCDERLIYYPTTSWYIAVEKFRNQLVANNEKINWVPAHVQKGRFGKWLEGARDWAVSRNRYWGAPLPVWMSEEGEVEVIGSREDLRKQKFTDNCYWLMRHGEAENNVRKVLVDSENGYPLTEKGKQQVAETAEKLKKDFKIDIILSSPVERARETAEAVGQVLGIKPQYFAELSERKFGSANEQPDGEYRQNFKNPGEYLTHAPEGGETGLALRQRVYQFLKEQDQKNKGKNILVVAHRGPLRSLQSACLGLTNEEHTAQREQLGLELGETRKLEFALMPYNEEGQLDLHRPYIDEIEFFSSSGKKMKRIEEVFDCWYESGAMPYAQDHFPFENQEKTKESFPADFITEALEQTRGWFYTLHVLATALTLDDIGLGQNQPAFKNVIAHGLILTETGEKLSKHLKNYTPPSTIFDRYGADALRFYFLNQSSLGGNYTVSEDKIRETYQKVIGTFDNCVQFYLTYAPKDLKEDFQSDHILDRWMMSRLHQIGQTAIEEMDNYRVDRTARLFLDLVDDLSNWYIRRSRARLQNLGPETKKAATVLHSLLLETSRLMAPFTPFVAEKAYQSLSPKGWPESVHLNDYFSPDPGLIDEKLMEEMAWARQIVRLALQARAKSGQKVRQPLAELRIKGPAPTEQSLGALIVEEINVKEISFVDQLPDSSDWTTAEEPDLAISLCHRLTPELEKEGKTREIVRAIQSLRKEAGLTPQDKVAVYYQGAPELNKLVEDARETIKKENRAEKVELLEKEKEFLGRRKVDLGGQIIDLIIDR